MGSKPCFSASWLHLPKGLGYTLGLDFIDVLNSRVAVRCLNLLKKGDHIGYLKLELDVGSYTSAAAFREDYAAVSVLSKYPWLSTGYDLRAVALKKFWESEEKCRSTNSRFNGSVPSKDGFTASVLFTAQRKIQNLLGTLDWDEAESGFGFGPGASFRLPKSKGSPYYKLQDVPETTADNLIAARRCIDRVPAWLSSLGGQDLVVVPGNKVTTVPKNAKTDRTIAIEPLMNMYVQKGLGSVIRRRLKRVGINLDSQLLNQQLAYEGSVTGELATIDLSAASDCVSTGLVRSLLPPDWFFALDMCRSHRGVLDGNVFYYHKFSSMGNGFTFELESLLFWALAAAVCETLSLSTSKVGVYGDDIIVPTDAAGPLIDVLSFCGFTTNKEKTFVKGPFRESCGKHYFQGVDVTPIYFRKEIDRADLLVASLNGIRRYAHRAGPKGFCDGRFQFLWEFYRSYLGDRFQAFIPDGYGDLGLIVNFDEASPTTYTRPGRDKRFRYWEGYRCNTLQRIRKTVLPEDPAAILAWLYLAEARDGVSEGLFTVPGTDEVFRNGKMIVQEWGNLGPWS